MFFSLYDLSVEEIETVLKTAETLKMQRRIGQTVKTLEGKVIALIFQKPSTRTKVSFLAGISQLGGTPLYLDGKDLQLGRGETIEDTARVLSRYVDAIVARVYDHSDLEGLAEHGSIPVINALSDDYHPCQALADILTIYEKVNKVKGIKLANFNGLEDHLYRRRRQQHGLTRPFYWRQRRVWISPWLRIKIISPISK